jgi:hypothetical protein
MVSLKPPLLIFRFRLNGKLGWPRHGVEHTYRYPEGEMNPDWPGSSSFYNLVAERKPH